MRKGLVLALGGVALAGCLLRAAAAEEKWVRFKSAEGGFVVSLPGKPRYLKKTMNHGQVAMELHNYAAVGDSSAFIVSYLDCPEDAVNVLGQENLLKGFRDGFAKGARSKLQSEKKITWNGISGVELRLDSGTGVRAVCRVGIVKNRLYQILVTGPGDTVDSPTVVKYFNSFKVLAVPGPNAAATKGDEPEVSVKAVEKPGAAEPAPSAAPALARPEDGGWMQRRLKGGFSVKAPGVMAYDRKRVSAGGGLLTLHQYLLEAKGESYHAGYVDYPESGMACGVQDVLDAERNRLVGALDGRLTNDQPLEFKGNRGSQCRIELPNGRSAMLRLYVVGTRLYQVMAVTPTESSYSDTSVRFLDSFRLAK